jgi:hypothetical protein
MVGDVPTMVAGVLTTVFGGEKKFSILEAIFSTAETVVEAPKTMFPAAETVVLTIKAMVFLLETMVCGIKTFFPEAKNIFYASETGFSITEKTCIALWCINKRIFKKTSQSLEVIVVDSPQDGTLHLSPLNFPKSCFSISAYSTYP